jgi:hypothetical protein
MPLHLWGHSVVWWPSSCYMPHWQQQVLHSTGAFLTNQVLVGSGCRSLRPGTQRTQESCEVGHMTRLPSGQTRCT